MSEPETVSAPPPPRVRLSLGVTGHRAGHTAFVANAARIEAVLAQIFDAIDAAVAAAPAPFGEGSIAPTRLHSMLADGADQIAARSALARGWELVAPLPFGRALNAAINALPANADDARALLDGGDAEDGAVQARADNVRALYASARLFELADHDDAVTRHFLATQSAPEDLAKAQGFAALSSKRVALAARVMIEQSDLIVAVWDGVSHFFVGGTGHTVAAALELGAPVLWVDADTPEAWRILRTPESLTSLAGTPPSVDERVAALKAIICAVLAPEAGSDAHRKSHGKARGGQPASQGVATIAQERWHARSNGLWHAYRRIEALFGGDKKRSPLRSLTARYETPDAIAAGSGAVVLAAAGALPGADPTFAERIEQNVLRRYAWADGVSSHLSDVYRGGMVANFVLSALAIVIGIAYLPFATADEKGYFAAIEFLMLAAIITITTLGQRRRWHGRWFETRRVAEYFRHAPLLLTLGVARAPGRWPRGTETSWPEWYARQGLREVGLPAIVVTRPYLRAALQTLLDDHVVRQRDYHHAKAQRLTTVHHNLDRLSEALFILAVISVALFLGLTAFALLADDVHELVYPTTKMFTFLGVLLPTFGASIAGIRYFGDFERFAAISEVTAEKLNAVHARITLLLAAGDDGADYSLVADLAHAADDIVVSEIENWQAVFGGKHVTVPV
ncbi:MAG: hypothetical protein SGJ23_08520 [Alphaproteobacteria bacterium]|nr:hypothetical protein [Alphaproteobacteria bacterium]